MKNIIDFSLKLQDLEVSDVKIKSAEISIKGEVEMEDVSLQKMYEAIMSLIAGPVVVKGPVHHYERPFKM